MLISPILNPKKLYKPLDTDNLSLKNLLHEAAIRKEGAILSFLPDVNVEQSAFQNIELCTHILYYNFRQLLRLPTLGNVDQKKQIFKYLQLCDNDAAVLRRTRIEDDKLSRSCRADDSLWINCKRSEGYVPLVLQIYL